MFDTYMDDIFAQTDKLYNKNQPKTLYYFVTAHTINGGRFYSETFSSSIEAMPIYNDYKNMVDFFGGGYVELFRIDENDFEIISISRV